MRATLKRLRHWISEERGSALLLMPIGAVLFATATVLSVDTGLMLNDRRDAQATVDAMALAGAQELTLEAGDDSTVGPLAEAAAEAWGEANGLDLADPDLAWTIEPVRNCYSADDGVFTGVRVTIERTPAMALLDFFGASWRSGATAIACAGRPLTQNGFLPFAVTETGACFAADGAGGYNPRIGSQCLLQVSNGDMSTGLNSTLGLDPDGDCPDGNPSGAELRTQIESGVQIDCTVGESISAGPGNTSGPVRQGLETRLASEGDCEDNTGVSAADLTTYSSAVASAGYPALRPPSKTNNIDDLFEVWAPEPGSGALTALTPYDCSPDDGAQTSPRNVLVVIIHDYTVADGAGPKKYIVRGFARVYIEGCRRGATFRQDCQLGGGSFEIVSRMVEQVGPITVPLGLNSYGDIGIFLKQ